jgi:hypothetical protein
MKAESSACRNYPLGFLLPSVGNLDRCLQIHRRDKLSQSDDRWNIPENAGPFDNTALHGGSHFPAFFAG